MNAFELQWLGDIPIRESIANIWKPLSTTLPSVLMGTIPETESRIAT